MNNEELCELSTLIEANLFNLEENINNAFDGLVNITDGNIAEKIASYLGKANLYKNYLEICINKVIKLTTNIS